MLSSSTASAPSGSASASCASVSTSTSILTRWPIACARPLDRRPHAAGDGDVVVLDQHGVIEAEAVVGAAADPHGVLLQRAQPGVVLRVQQIRVRVPATARTTRAVAEAMPLRCDR